MKKWLKYGLIGGIIGSLIFLIPTLMIFLLLKSFGVLNAFWAAIINFFATILRILSLLSWHLINIYMRGTSLLLRNSVLTVYYFIIGFILGVIINWIVGKVKKK